MVDDPLPQELAMEVALHLKPLEGPVRQIVEGYQGAIGIALIRTVPAIGEAGDRGEIAAVA